MSRFDAQLRGHDRFLAQFRDAFHTLDSDNNGVLTGDEFSRLVRRIAPAKTELEVEEMLISADPYDNQQITFSEAVVCCSEAIVDLMVSVAHGAA